MKWRIRKCGHGGYEAEKGMQTEPGTRAPSGIGCIMPAFVVCESVHFDTYYEAERYIEHLNKQKPLF